jgi:N-formylglutamate deformylase
MSPVTVIRGDGPVVLAQPHSGTFVPADIQARLNARGQRLEDTDWRVPELYEGLLSEATIVRANFSRYVIDANRPPDNASLYPGQNTTGLVPLHDFDGEPIWQAAPDEADIAQRVRAFHRPYHAALAEELERVRARRGSVVLYDCHSIRSVAPYLFDGTLPDFNIGTNSGQSCAAPIEQAAAAVCAGAAGYTSVVNGRFRGGWTTRHYGQPANGVHAIQMELAQSAYLESETQPFTLSSEKSARLRDVLARVLSAIVAAHGDLI